MKKKNIVILSGAGISAESGIPTFRDANGLWEGHDVMEVASIEGWRRNPSLVQEFYNLRRRAASLAQANVAHLALAKLESKYNVAVITQNVDLLHEQAGSSQVIHLHGRLDQAKSSVDDRLVYPIVGDEIKMGDLCEKGSQLRPNIVWFGEAVPAIEEVVVVVSEADILIIVGTSLQVYPAAGLKEFAPNHCKTFLIDKKIPNNKFLRNITFFEEAATVAVPKLVEQLLD
ncbi:Sir2 family NAD-dependent protein deacetylase [Sphingobacterium sp. 2149]|uniref:SIR2 family NAD-dependent protein deacylase n=1 Tax=Sphingobacterium sp. 2149 TaxID=2817763 RepID=UPI001AE2585E|nr:Sir2 family NAD-dependent protein deacetylase [Sphingobacterium sp. 2149]MDR6737905.1 NAD-dependent deacetylase [Sphingobacterium sp. 2149]